MTFEDEYVKSYKAYLESLEELERKENEILKKLLIKVDTISLMKLKQKKY
ncbi:hypothetical protein [Macrococcus animalis]